MNKRFAMGALVLLVGGALFGFWLRHSSNDYNINAYVTDADRLAAAKKLGYAAPANTAVLAPVDLKRPLRVAIGSLGFKDEQQNLAAGDLVLTDLSGAKGIELVERRSLDKALQEINMSLARLTRARDAVRAGKLLRADWFLLGTETQINGTNSVVVRVVDAHTGVLRDAGVVSHTQSVTQLARDIAAFVRSSRENAAMAKTRVYVAIGGFQDLSVNDRLADFPTLLRGYLTAAYIGSGVTLLEREAVDTLLNEVHLDMAGLTDEATSNAPAPLQSAFWLVTGQYQSYETTNREVELKLNVQRIFGGLSHVSLRGQPGEAIGRQIKDSVDAIINKNTGLVIPSLVSEIRAQMNIGKDVTPFDNTFNNTLNSFGSSDGYSYADRRLPAAEAATRKRNREEAMRAFKTVLLLDPKNHEAKMRLAECLRSQVFDQFDAARDLYREIIEDPARDNWTDQAQKALVHSFNIWSGQPGDPAAKARWFETALAQTTNSSATEFYRQQVTSSRREATLALGEGPEAEAIAVEDLLKSIKYHQEAFEGKTVLGVHLYGTDLGTGEYVRFFGTNRDLAAKKLTELLPKMESQNPKLKPILVARVLTFQRDTNSPVVDEFRKMLLQINDHPRDMLAPDSFWDQLMPMVSGWCLNQKLYSLAAQGIEMKIRADGLNMDGVLTNQTITVAYDKIALARAYAGLSRMEESTALYESISNLTIRMQLASSRGTGQSMLPFGYQEKRDAREFDIGDGLFCLCTPSAFAKDDQGFWIAIENRLLHIDFNLKTNLVVTLPKETGTPITSIAIGESNIWVGTDGEGLIQFDKANRRCIRQTQKDGLLMNNIGCLHLSATRLWIGYGHGTYKLTRERTGTAGGLGMLDLAAGKFSSFTPSLLQDPRNKNGPPRIPLIMIEEGTAGDIWFVPDDEYDRLSLYDSHANKWEVTPQYCTSLAANAHTLFIGQGGRISSLLGGNDEGPPGLSYLNFEDGQWRDLKQVPELPRYTVTTLAPAGDNLWVGGVGYVALIDVQENKVIKFAYIPAGSVEQIELAGGYLWTLFNGYLHRTPLPGGE